MRMMLQLFLLFAAFSMVPTVGAQGIQNDLNVAINKEMGRLPDHLVEETKTRFCKIHLQSTVAVCDTTVNYRGGNANETVLLVFQRSKANTEWRLIYSASFDDRQAVPWASKSRVVSGKLIKVPKFSCHPDQRNSCNISDTPITVRLPE